MSVPVRSGVVDVHVAEPDRAAELVRVVHAGFAARPPLDPPSTALEETVESVSAALAEHGGLVAEIDGRVVGGLLFRPRGPMLMLRRVAVHPGAQRLGVAGALVGMAEHVAAERGFHGVCLEARAELPASTRFWTHLGYAETARRGTTLTMAKEFGVEMRALDSDDTRRIGERLAGVLQPGDLLILSGDLGAGKTTFAQGLGAGLHVRGEVTSPTFVIARVHPSLVGGPALVHVDAYRLGGIAELDDLDLDASLEDAVTVVEWGVGVAEGLTESRLDVTISRPRGTGAAASDGEDPRTVRLAPVGAAWIGRGLRDALT